MNIMDRIRELIVVSEIFAFDAMQNECGVFGVKGYLVPGILSCSGRSFFC